MIKINISEDKIKILEEGHKKWYKEKIYPQLQNAIRVLEEAVNKFSKDRYKIIRKYIKLLKYIEKKDSNFVIEKDYKLGLTKDEILFYLKNIKRSNSEQNSLLDDELVSLEKSNKDKIELKKMYSPYFLFRYEQLGDGTSENSWGRHKILRLMGVNVCPYCQRNYISSYEEKEQLKTMEKQYNKTTADLDHFIPKSVVPFLALSLYNFIPSCQICNSRMKLDKLTIDLSNFENIVINPFVESFDDYGIKFKLENKSTAKLLDTKKKSLEEFKIIIENKFDNQKIKNTIDMFKLDKIYENNHSDYIVDMFENIRNRPDSYLNSIVNIFMNKKYFNDEELKKEMLDNLKEIVLEPYKFKVKKGEPLGKLTKDILEEFGINI